MAEQRGPGSDEKQEKEEEKQEKPQTYEEKWQRDPLSTVIWAGILILGGFILLVDNLGILPFLEGRGWSLAFIAAGMLLLAEAILRYLIPEYRRPLIGILILAAVFFSIGLGGFGLSGLVWPLVIIVIGVGLLLGAFRR